MTLKEPLLAFLLISPTLTLRAQTPPPTPKPSPADVAGIPVNYDEAKVGTYSLPDPLRLNNGKPVRNAKTWYSKRRPEIVAMFETQQYGRAPEKPADESFEIVDKGTPALNGKAIRKQVTIYLNKDKTGPSIDLLIYLPAAATKPVPMFFSINFGVVQNAVDDPGIQPETAWDPKANTRITPPAGPGFGHIDARPCSMLASVWRPTTTATSTPTIPPDFPMAFALDTRSPDSRTGRRMSGAPSRPGRGA